MYCAKPSAASCGGAYLEEDALHDAERPLKVHVVAHALGLPAGHGRVGTKACLELPLSQKIDPYNLFITPPHLNSVQIHPRCAFALQ